VVDTDELEEEGGEEVAVALVFRDNLEVGDEVLGK